MKQNTKNQLKSRLVRARRYREHDPDLSKSLKYAAQSEEGDDTGADPLDGEICSEEEWKTLKAQETEARAEGAQDIDATFSFS